MSNLDFRLVGRLTMAALALALSACASGRASPPPPPQPAKPPQVVYRIDDHRYFELTPDETCFGNMLYFVNTAKGIRSEVVTFDAVMNRTTLIIDAANDQYLVAPVTRGGTNCSSGGGRCGERLPYSVDGGRTWKRAWAPSPYYDLMLSGATAYQSHRNEDLITNGLDLTNLPTTNETNWKFLRDFSFKPLVSPIDTKVLCKANDGGSRK